jgi:hypothetical protein
MLGTVCLHVQHVTAARMYSYVFQREKDIMCKYKVNVNIRVVSRTEFNALSNGALGFSVS